MKLFIFLNLLTIAWAFQGTPPYPVLRFKFEVNPKRTNKLMGTILNSEEYGPALKNIKASSLLTSTNIHKLSLDEWNLAKEGSKLNFSRIDVDKCKEVVRTLKIETSHEYTRLMSVITDPMSQMKAALNEINVNDIQIMYYTMMNTDGNETFFDLFKDANFSNMAAATKHLKLTDEQLFDFWKAMGLRYLDTTNLQDFSRLVKNITGEVSDFNVGYEKDQVGLIKTLFNILEVDQEHDFAELINTYNKSIISPLILATRVKTGGYLSSGAIYSEFQRMGQLYAKPFLVENEHKYEVKTASFKSSLAEFQTTDNVIFIPKDGLVSGLDKCLYAPHENEMFEVNAVESSQEMTITKETNVFVMGAPLFCDGQLVGVALGETSSSIIFAKIPFKMAAVPQPPIVKPADKPELPVLPVSPANNDFIASLDFHVIPAKIPNLVAYLLMDTVNGNQSQTNTAGVTPQDVVNEFRLSNLAYVDFIKYVPKSNLEFVDVNQALEYLKVYNVSLVNIINSLMGQLTTQQKLDVVKALNISLLDVQFLNIFHNNDEAKYREFLANANLTRANIEAAIKATNLTDPDLYKLVTSVVLETIGNSSLFNTLQLLQRMGGYDTLQKHIAKQQLTPESFTQLSGFQNILDNFDTILSGSSAVAPIISNRNILTATAVYDHYNDPTTREFVSLNVTTHNQQYQVEKITVNRSGYANITLVKPLGVNTWLPLATDADPKSCQMITDKGAFKVLKAGKLREGYEVILDEVVTRETYKLGAGLVCQGRLYGVASKLIASPVPERIQFAAVRKGVQPSATGNKPSNGYKMSSSIILMLCTICGRIYLF